MTCEYEKLNFSRFLPARITYASTAEFSPRPMHWHRSIEPTSCSDVRAFIQHFKQKFNKTPSQYRKEMKKSHF